MPGDTPRRVGGRGKAHPLVVDGEVVVQVHDALGLLQELAVRGLGPPVHQIPVAIVLTSCKHRAGTCGHLPALERTQVRAPSMRPLCTLARLPRARSLAELGLGMLSLSTPWAVAKAVGWRRGAHPSRRSRESAHAQ